MPREVGVEYSDESGKNLGRDIGGLFAYQQTVEQKSCVTPKEFVWVCGLQSLIFVKAVSC